MASNINALLIKNGIGLERPIIPAHILNNASMRTPLNQSIYSNHIFKYTLNLTEAFRLTEIYSQLPAIIYNDNRSGG